MMTVKGNEQLMEIKRVEGKSTKTENLELVEKRALHSETEKQIKEYLAGERKHFNLGVRTEMLNGTQFQRAVWQILISIPYGETRSYKWMAEQLGQPKAVRAVANACGKNPLPIIIPCHRVVASDGSLGGFALGIETKKKLLAVEKIMVVGEKLKTKNN
jgi:O-6-methylguanine DNA methyltransferase